MIQQFVQFAARLSNEDKAQITKLFAEALRGYQELTAAKNRAETERALALQGQRFRHEIFRQTIDNLFEERREVVRSYFAALDHGMHTNDQATVLAAMRSLGELIATSPFVELKRLSEALEGGPSIEI